MVRTSRLLLLKAIAATLYCMVGSGRAQPGNIQVTQPTEPDLFEQCLNTGDAALAYMRAMIECNRQELERSDVIVDRTYAAVRIMLNPVQQRKLSALQRRWTVRRERKCDAERAETGGQDGIFTWYGCMSQEAEKRVKWLTARKS